MIIYTQYNKTHHTFTPSQPLTSSKTSTVKRHTQNTHKHTMSHTLPLNDTYTYRMTHTNTQKYNDVHTLTHKHTTTQTFGFTIQDKTHKSIMNYSIQ